MRRNLLQSQGIVFILFGILLALVGMSADGLVTLILDILALIAGVFGVALSLSKDQGAE